MAFLTVERGERAGERFPFVGKLFALGRDPANHMCVLDEEASRYHAKIVLKDGQYIISDLSSTNGTMVNGKPITEAVLEDGDAIVVGKTLLLFQKGLPEDYEKPVEASADVVSDSQQESRVEMSVSLEEVKRFKAETHFGDEEEEIENAAQELQKDRKNLILIYEISNLLGSVFEVEDLLGRILDMIMSVIKADRGFVVLTNRDAEKMLVKAGRKRATWKSKEILDEEEAAISSSIVEEAIRIRSGVMTSNAMTDERFKDSSSVFKHKITSAMCVPLEGSRDILGVIYVDSSRGPSQFTADELRLLTAIGHEVGRAIENARFYELSLRTERLAGMGQVMAGLSHYMKNILTYLKVACSVVEDGFQNEKQELAKKGWVSIKSGIDKLSGLIMDLLKYSKDHEVKFTECNVDALVKQICELVHPEGDKRPIVITCDLCCEGKSFLLDSEGIHNVLLNLLLNATDALGIKGGKLEVRTSLKKKDNLLQIEVSDNGPGIPEEKLPQIFDIFYTTKEDGTGLGLFVAKRIVEAHGGTIQASSKPGQGTTFVITLPAQRPL